jgi:pyrroloquinoline quinone biosynthesis protein D
MSLDGATLPRLGRGFRLQWEEAQGCHVLLYPEGMIKLNRSAGEILQRCDGCAPLAAIVAQLETAFNTQGLRAEVEQFLVMAATQRWVVLA